jgi:hypothetical protein
MQQAGNAPCARTADAGTPGPAPMKVRSIFLSDVHLGTRGCQAERLLEFLREHEAQYLYLVGDIVDFWAMSRASTGRRRRTRSCRRFCVARATASMSC